MASSAEATCDRLQGMRAPVMSRPWSVCMLPTYSMLGWRPGGVRRPQGEAADAHPRAAATHVAIAATHRRVVDARAHHPRRESWVGVTPQHLVRAEVVRDVQSAIVHERHLRVGGERWCGQVTRSLLPSHSQATSLLPGGGHARWHTPVHLSSYTLAVTPTLQLHPRSHSNATYGGGSRAHPILQIDSGRAAELIPRVERIGEPGLHCEVVGATGRMHTHTHGGMHTHGGSKGIARGRIITHAVPLGAGCG